MVSDQELARYVESLVRQAAAHPAAAGGGISVEAVVRQLEAQLGVDLTPKAPLVRDVLVALLGPAPAPHPAPAPRSKDPFAPASPRFSSAAASASSSPAPHFFSPPQQPPTPQQLQSYLAATQQQQQQQQYHHRAGSPYEVPAQYRYAAQPYPPQPGDAQQLQRLVQLQQYQQHQQQQQKMAATAAAAAAAAVTLATPGESPRAAAAAPPAASKKDSSGAGVKRRGGPGGLNKVCGVSPELQVIVGEPTMARTEIVKQLWAYIRRNNLQDPNNKRKIICNDELRVVFETDSTDMFKMNKLLAKHIRSLETTKSSNRESKKSKPVDKDNEPISLAEPETDVNQLPIIVSDALASFFGTEEREMPQSDAVKRVWDHIKSNNLEDPANPTMILCDSKLKQLFGCESLTALGVSELLSHHLFKQPNKI